jgi:amino acid transporter
MADEKVFARRASGLVRGLSMVDAFGVGFMNQGVTPSMWVMISLGLSIFTGGNLIWATIISTVLCGIGFSLVWGILGGSMPRSGGEYIYNSRILHPLIGIAESFGNAFVWIMWIYVLAPYTVDPGLTMIFEFLGAPATAEWLRTPLGMFLAASVINVIGLLFVVFGVKLFATAQKVVMVLGMVGCFAFLVIFSLTSASGFQDAWNQMAAENPVAEVDLSMAALEAAEVDLADDEAVLGFLQTQLWGRTPTADVLDPSGNVILAAGRPIDDVGLAALAQLRTEEAGLAIPTVAVQSLTYDGFLTVVQGLMESGGSVLPTTWNWRDTLGVMVAGSWMFAYSYAITFIAGEVKRPDKTIILGNLFAVVVPGVLMLWLAIALYNSVGFQFLTATAYVDQNIGQLAGTALPWSPHFIGLAAVISHNPIILLLMGLSFVAFSLWYVALSYLAFPRILFAWGMDRVGPRWFTNINPRYATPVWNHILCLVLGELGILIYAFFQNPMTGLSVTGLEIVSVFGVTAIAAALFPYLKKVRHIWEASPYSKWKILKVPVITIGAVVNLIYLGILFYFFFFMSELGEQELVGNSLILYAVIWGFGILWYLGWRWWNKRQADIDVGMAYDELPPE